MSPSFSTSSTAARTRALFETTKRVLAQSINDGLVDATIEPFPTSSKPQCVILRGKEDVGILPYARVELNGVRVTGFLRPDDLQLPVQIEHATGGLQDEVDPGTICQIVCLWQTERVKSEESLVREVRNSAENQDKWLEMEKGLPRLSLRSPLIDWERSCILGHPTHPLHRTLLAQPPLKPIDAAELPTLLDPEVSFISVPRTSLHVTGPFEQLIKPLFDKLDVFEPSSERIIVPCFSRQLPSIRAHFSDVIHIKSVEHCAQAHISMRTVSIRPELGFTPHLKLSLNCQITSGPRTITPWTALAGPVVTQFLKKLLPPDLWVYGEIASITGSQTDFDRARHLTCIIRENLENKAEQENVALIPATGLYQKPFGDDRTYAEILFELDTLDRKRDWFRHYTANLLRALLPPLASHGIGLESHSQNIVVRVHLKTKEIVGFAVRDFGGVRLHRPSLQRAGCDLSSVPPGGPTITDDLHSVWCKVHHSLLQVHLGHLLYMLGLEPNGGWPVVRDEIERALKPIENEGARKLYAYFMKRTMQFKCFMIMRLKGFIVMSTIANTSKYYERELPNIVLRD
ncbi:uncharacterized protein P174DRAFT_510732 [Aspergillus novofumigatus IBT 16806]|uniref:IucC family-domain-containing protein n=1 Tax=Aspergillus novofumigatus (strain IBT 16806) TaxID=1392255 RepID=A0A2I1CJM9_ASPN1|nr:uncharacterized protein P174DRAFT_510732 [Aspergillus novofumigatus IBT 16806]PKX97831.1 hypothetical protein P174DRAFT_510732 [Aspergillus novofumigatus IBT 16806]